MANSGYYHDLYRQKKSEVGAYKDDLKNLRRAYEELTDNSYQRIAGINSKLESLQDDLYSGIRHETRFTVRANELTTRKESGVTADGTMRTVLSTLEEEIARLENLKTRAELDKDRFYQTYKEKKAEELNEFFSNLL